MWLVMACVQPTASVDTPLGIRTASVDLIAAGEAVPVEPGVEILHLVQTDALDGRIMATGTGGVRVFQDLEVTRRHWALDTTFGAWLDADHALIGDRRGAGVLNLETGQIERGLGFDVPVASARDQDVLYVLDRGGNLVRHDQDFQVVASGFHGARSVAVLDGKVLVGEPGAVTQLAGETGVRVPVQGTPNALLPVDGGLVAAMGGRGLVFLDDDLTVTHTLPLPGVAQDLALDAQGVLWVASTEFLVAVDPVERVVLAQLPTLEFSLAVEPMGDGAFVMDWSYAHHVTLEGGGPVVRVDHERVSAPTTVQVDNLGAVPLQVGGNTVAPGASLQLAVDVGDRLPTNDPGRPWLDFLQAPAVGDAAPPLRLQSLEGAWHDLEDLRGQPVVVVFFATWCPICPVDLAELQDRNLDVPILLVAPADDRHDLVALRDQLQIGAPILIDDVGAYTGWSIEPAFDQTLFPQHTVVDATGVVTYRSNRLDLDALEAAVQRAR